MAWKRENTSNMTVPKVFERMVPERVKARLAKLDVSQGAQADFDALLETVPPAHRAVVVLGCAPGEQMEARLTTALPILRRELEKDPKTLAVVSGGVVHPGSELSESAIMKAWFVAHGIPAESVVAENFSTTTAQNAQNVAQVLKRAGLKPNLHLISDFAGSGHNLHLVTERFHSGRAHALFVRALHEQKLDTLVPFLHVDKADDGLTTPQRAKRALSETVSRVANQRTWDQQKNFSQDG